MAVTFSDVQNILDAILTKSAWAQGQPPPLNPPPHGAFWRQTGPSSDPQLFYAQYTYRW